MVQGFAEELNEEFTYSRRPALFRLFGSDGTPGDVLDELPGQEIIMKGTVDGEMVNSFLTTPLMGHTLYHAVVSGRHVAGTTDRFELRVYDEAGSLTRLIRAPFRDLPVSSEEWRRVIDEELADAETPSRRAMVMEVAELRPAPVTRPAYDRFVADAEGYVWLAPYRPTPHRPVPWLVVDLDGSILGDVELPEGFTPVEIGSAHVLGVVRDEFDVPYLKMYGLTR